MKKLVYIMAGLALTLASCEDQLDSTNYTQKTTATFPETVTDANQMLTAVYQTLNQVHANPQTSFFYYSVLASDNNLGGGGMNDKLMQAEDLLLNYQSDMTRAFWQDRYRGIFRANNLIATLGNCKGITEETYNQLMGEALFLRAFFYYELASMYGNVPLLTTTDASDLPGASAADMFGQILLDLKTAADIMPAQAQMGSGHVDKYCAEALLGRVFLYYTGMYCNGETIADLTSTTYNPMSSVVLADGSTLTKDQVASYIDDCVKNSGYSLVPDFRNLWAYTNRCTVEDYDYTKGQNLKWVEDDNGINPEAMFMVKFNKLADWQTTIGYANGYALHFGVRGGQGYGDTFPFGQGWGAGPVAPNFVNDWKAAEPTDMRRDASIQDVNELPNHAKGAAGWADFAQETDYYGKKLSPVSCKNDGSLADITDEYLACFENVMYGTDNWIQGANNMQLNNIHDHVLIRFAEVLLMQSELKGNADGMNKVRARAGLPAKDYSIENIRNERRWELSFEGIRWNDIRRFHIAAAALEKQTGVPIYTSGTPDTNKKQGVGYAARYNATAGFAKIPESQVSLSKHLQQAAGYDGADSEYNGWQ